jgi:hypothetical protein
MLNSLPRTSDNAKNAAESKCHPLLPSTLSVTLRALIRDQVQGIKDERLRTQPA